MTRFLKIAIVSVAVPFLTRLASSRSVPSRTPCRPFSMPQCPRVSPSSSFAPARWRDRLVIPSTISVSTFSPVLRTRLRRKTCAHPGQSGPRYSASEVVTSIDRSSIRPCPLSTSRARSTSASPRATWRGGKAGRGLGEGRRDVPGQRRLVLLDRQDVVAPALDHGRADVAMGEHSIAGDDLALEREHSQQLQGGLVL